MRQFSDLLIELHTEELPPKSLRHLSRFFANSISEQLKKASLSFSAAEVFATPRRLAVLYRQIQTQQEDKLVERKGPAIKAAFDAEGQPTQAAQGWARSLGIEASEAGRLKTDKGEWLVFQSSVKGLPITELLPSIIQTAAKQLPVPKMMRWGEGTHAFIRPLKGLTVLLDQQVIPMTLFGVESSNQIAGHRFHHAGTFTLTHAAHYESQLLEAFVIASFEKRQQSIQSQIAVISEPMQATPQFNQDLLDEVTALVEWPVALKASFDSAFLTVPQEAIIFTMQDDQRYFALTDSTGRLLPEFIFISNIKSKKPNLVTYGNEKVIRPRLADAQFFFETDKQTSLESKSLKLKDVLFQSQLGSISAKTKRIAKLATYIAPHINANSKLAERAALLSKADLVSLMVQEFPEVQGIMGKYYARNDGESPLVAQAIEEHYLPRFSGDRLPESDEGAAVSLADKIDSLIGIFAIGQIPRADRDPFALRRSAIGMLRILIEKKYDLNLQSLLKASAQAYHEQIEVTEETQQQVFEFLLGRFPTFYQDLGIDSQTIAAVLTLKPVSAYDFHLRVQAVTDFNQLEEAQSLAAANKRVSNILAKESLTQSLSLAPELFSTTEESELFAALQALPTQAVSYSQSLLSLAQLKTPIDRFFEKVMVNDKDDKIRLNRLALLQQLNQRFNQVADISKLQSD